MYMYDKNALTLSNLQGDHNFRWLKHGYNWVLEQINNGIQFNIWATDCCIQYTEMATGVRG